MTKKRKRTRPNTQESGQKRQKTSHPPQSRNEPIIKHALLAQYYPQVFTLREYLLRRLPNSSKIRRKKILSVGRNQGAENELEVELARFLDQTLVGESGCLEVSKKERWSQWGAFSQRGKDEGSTLVNLSGPGVFSQSEIVDFAIWLLFSKKYRYTSNGNSQHLLCQGFQKDLSARAMGRDDITSAIPGLQSTYPNSHVTSMKSRPWPQVLLLMGKEGERAMIDLILDCGIFLEVETGRGVYHQLCGIPLGELQTVSAEAAPAKVPVLRSKPDGAVKRTPSAITFVRNRIFYARAALNAKGGIRFGLRHIHVLNRYPLKSPNTNRDSPVKPDYSTIHVLMYIFPRQFGLHNVFTSELDSQKTVQPFMDYTLREDEINKKYPSHSPPKIPKRLRGKATELVKKMQILHGRCSYKELIEYYCPVTNGAPRFPIPKPQTQPSNESSAKFKTQMTVSTASTVESPAKSKAITPRKLSMMNYATPEVMVSAFCQAVLSKIIPKELWGTGDVQTHNEKVFLKNVDRFIRLRRFESLSLHEVSQGLQISSIGWLQPPTNTNNKASQSDLTTRLSIFHELLYYLFDSLLIPLLRTNFHITESSVHKNRLFYFRHDVWRSLSEPAMATLKTSMFSEIPLSDARKLLEARTLGYSQVRLLPKENGVRPIMNLRRRMPNKKWKNNLGPSINSTLAPVHNMFTYESTSNPSRLGSTLFSINDLYAKLKTFKFSLAGSNKPLYFAKVDVTQAFDTIPQSAVLALMSSLPRESEYQLQKHLQMKPNDNYRLDPSAKASRKYSSLAYPLEDCVSFAENLENLVTGRKNAVFVENVVPHTVQTSQLLSLLREHVTQNIVKIGKRFYRQSNGIPQGSVLSSLLCNYFYADLEATHLSFLNEEGSLLMRLTDDFLLITTNPSHAKKFLQTMHDGLPSYGVRVNPDKTLVNFEAEVNGKKIRRLVEDKRFPYCGTFVDVKSLDVSRDRERRREVGLGDSMTVEFCRGVGRGFYRKTLNALKIQSHALFLDTSLNSLRTVLSNIHSAFLETAMKMWTYNKLLPPGKKPGTKLLMKTINDTIDLAFVLMKSKGKNAKNKGFACNVTKVMVEWLAIHTFRDVLRKRQSSYGEIIEWLEGRIEVLRERESEACARMAGIVGGSG